MPVDELALALTWHREGKASVLAALASLGFDARADVEGTTPNGTKWKAEVLFTAGARSVVVQLQRGYQPLREFRRRQARFAECGLECCWLFRRETFATLSANLAHTRAGAALPELPVAVLEQQRVEVGDSLLSLTEWLSALVDGTFRYRDGAWRVG